MSLGSLRQEIIDDAHSLVEAGVVDRKIIAAMRFMRDKRMWFSERSFSFKLTAGRAVYSPGDGLPNDVVEIVGKELWVLVGGSQDSRQACYRTATGSFEQAKLDGTGKSQPELWDFYGNQLRFYPTPSSSTDVVEGRYVVDIGVPVVRYEASAYKFYAPDGLRQLSAAELAAFANDWTDPRGAGPMIRARAAHLLYKEYLRDTEQADAWLTTWLEHVAVLENETEAKTAGATEVVPCLLD